MERTPQHLPCSPLRRRLPQHPSQHNTFTELSVRLPPPVPATTSWAELTSLHDSVPSSRHTSQHPEIEPPSFCWTDIVQLRLLSAPPFGLIYENALNHAAHSVFCSKIYFQIMQNHPRTAHMSEGSLVPRRLKVL